MEGFPVPVGGAPDSPRTRFLKTFEFGSDPPVSGPGLLPDWFTMEPADAVILPPEKPCSTPNSIPEFRFLSRMKPVKVNENKKKKKNDYQNISVHIPAPVVSPSPVPSPVIPSPVIPSPVIASPVIPSPVIPSPVITPVSTYMGMEIPTKRLGESPQPLSSPPTSRKRKLSAQSCVWGPARQEVEDLLSEREPKTPFPPSLTEEQIKEERDRRSKESLKRMNERIIKQRDFLPKLKKQLHELEHTLMAKKIEREKLVEEKVVQQRNLNKGKAYASHCRDNIQGLANMIDKINHKKK